MLIQGSFSNVLEDDLATEINILSAGAVEPGLATIIDAFRRETGRKITVAFATAPEIRRRLDAGAVVDVIIAPSATLDESAKAGRLASGERVTVGRIGIGVAVRAGAPAPKIATVEEFKRALLAAGSVVYNRASTGAYIESLFERLGIAEELKTKTTRYPDFAGVLDHMRNGAPGEIGLGATTVIVEAKNKGLELVGPLPEEIQNYTVYEAGVAAQQRAADGAREFVRYLTTPAARVALAAAGIAS